MYKHIRLSVLYKYGQLDTGKTDDKPVENIILPILNVAYRLEDINVKDIEAYVNDPKNYYKSLLVRKFHNKWAREFEIDTFIDAVKTSWIDFGLGLVKNNGKKPEYVPLQRLAFCDQTDILSGPICEKHMFSPDQLKDMEGRWNSDEIEEAITMSRAEKAAQQVKGQKQKTPGKYIEVYELHGTFPEDWLDKEGFTGDPEKYVRQIHIVTYYKDSNKKNKKTGITLFKGPEKESIYDSVKRSSGGDDPYGRACGYGGAEELFEPQVWNTYSRIQMKEMLDIASAMIVKTTDAALAKRQRITDLEKGEILHAEEGSETSQLVITPINWEVFDRWQEDMKINARTIGSANDPQLGVEPKSGTPFRLQALVTNQGEGIHQYRRGLFSTFLARLYKNWFLKYLVNELNKGDEWMEDLTLKEMQWIADRVSLNISEKRKRDLILSGESTSQIEIDAFKEEFKEEFLQSGNKQFLTVLKDEFKDIPIDVFVNIANKQKDLSNEVDKIVNFIRAIVAAPQMLTAPGMEDLLNQVLEKSGLNPVDFSSLKPKELVPPAQQQQVTPAIEAPVAPAGQ